jgi:hypothetical protein
VRDLQNSHSTFNPKNKPMRPSSLEVAKGACEGGIFRRERVQKKHELSRSEPMSLGDDDDAWKTPSRLGPHRDVALGSLVARQPHLSVRGTVGQKGRVLRCLAEDVDYAVHAPPGYTSSLDVSVAPVLIGEEPEATGHYPPERGFRSSSAPSFVASSPSTKSASISSLWSL